MGVHVARRSSHAGGILFPVIGQIAWTATVVGPLQVWLVWYIGASISSGYVSRKIAQQAL
ncbi:hypothetical protein ACFFQF_10150 [Haladaptatus pallidirubidus]|uniref:hypothetical protein n=1 Tax=Haladaptatus pallidirubidus TaxID=1008152 RepID=UPI0035EB2651